MDIIPSTLRLEKTFRGLEARIILNDDPTLKEIYRYELEALVSSYPDDVISQVSCWRRFMIMGNYIRLEKGIYYLRFYTEVLKTPAWKGLIQDILSSWKCLKEQDIHWKNLHMWLTQCIGAHNIQVKIVQGDGGRIIAYRCIFTIIDSKE